MSSARTPDGLRAAEREPESPGYPAKAFSGFRLVRTAPGSAASCGNGVVECGEVCDGSDLGGALSGFRKAVRDTDEARDALTMDVQEQVAERSETRSRA